MRLDNGRSDRVQLELKCGKCGKVGKYDVGRVAIWFGKDRASESAYGYTAYFRCRGCGGAGPWEHTVKALMTLIALTGESLAAKSDTDRLIGGKLQLYDGTFISSPAEGEDILRERLQRDPGNGFLWCRLGNVLDNAEQVNPAKEAYARALEIREADIEANYRMGVIQGHAKAFDDAAAYFHRVLRHARNDTTVAYKLRRGIVVASLKHLFEISFATNGRIKPIPTPSAEDLSKAGEPSHLELKTYDIRSEKDLMKACESMAAGFLPLNGAPDDADAAGHEADLIEEDMVPDEDEPVGGEMDLDEDDFAEETESGTVISEPRAGRNDPCPCGSGKKFKKCCGRSSL